MGDRTSASTCVRRDASSATATSTACMDGLPGRDRAARALHAAGGDRVADRRGRRAANDPPGRGSPHDAVQETDPPFRTRIGEWFFDGTHWTLRPKTVYAAAGWVPWLVGQESSASVYVAATALRDMALREQSPPYPWYAILGNLPFGTVDVHVRDDRNLSIMRAYLLRRVGRSVRGFPLVFVQPDSWDESSDIRTPL